MKRKPVDSSMLLSVGYDAAEKLLELEFQNGRVYQYADVPRAIYRRLITAESLGNFFDEEIRGAYAYARLR